MLILLSQAESATVKAKSVSLSDVVSAIRLAREGDTVVVPAGTASWSSLLTITKGITLQGATTVTGPSTNPTANDATIIKDDTRRSGPGVGIIKVTLSSGQSFRLSGFTFQAGGSTTYAGGNGAIHLLSRDNSPNVSMRIDHCHFKFLYQPKDIWVSGWVFGVSDHCIHDCLPRTFSFLVWHDTYGGKSQENGNGSWADSPYWGSEKFFFIEDNTINGSGRSQTSGTIDAKCGARYVARHNAFNNAKPNSHGTQRFPQRGVRAIESYNNILNWTIKTGGGQLRSGVIIAHDNEWSGAAPRSAMVLTDYRQFNNFTPPGGANGANPWDVNDTEGNGTSVPGRRPHLYLTGTHTGGNNSQTLVVANAGWKANQWVGYQVTNTVTGANSVVLSNTSDTITASIYTDTKRPFHFNTGDKFAIYKLLIALDQPGRGRSDLLTGTNPVINSATRTATWPHNALEPCYSWNNIANGKPIGLSSLLPTIQENRDYYNQKTPFDGTVGAGVGPLADRPKTCTPGVAYWATDQGEWDSTHQGPDGQLYVCNASNTWTFYYKPYAYPHPLVSEWPPPAANTAEDRRTTTNATSSSNK